MTTAPELTAAPELVAADVDDAGSPRGEWIPILVPALLVRRVVRSHLTRVCQEHGHASWHKDRAAKAAEAFAVALRNVSPKAAPTYADQRLAKHGFARFHPEELPIYDEATRSPHYVSWVLRALAECF
jgi:hypothetical protein